MYEKSAQSLTGLGTIFHRDKNPLSVTQEPIEDDFSSLFYYMIFKFFLSNATATRIPTVIEIFKLFLKMTISIRTISVKFDVIPPGGLGNVQSSPFITHLIITQIWILDKHSQIFTMDRRNFTKELSCYRKMTRK